jgi:hypothetical protein
LVGLATYFTPGDIKNKLKTLLILSGSGAVFAIIYKNIKKDELEKLAEINKQKEKLYNDTKPQTT